MAKIDSLPGGIPNGPQVAIGCANSKNKCDSAQSNIPGYREWWYVDTFTLPAQCSSWRFSVYVPNRNTSTNIVGQPIFYVETILNSVAAPGNSSPVFSVKPVPYVCINQPYSYNNGGVDPNNDSLVFEVLQPLTVANCNSNPGTCTYQTKSPVLQIPSNPFQTNNTFNISSTTGQLSFTPGELGSHTVTVRAKEYRNGVFIGSVMRDIQVQVIPCTSTQPTVGTVSGTISGSAQLVGNTVVGCATQQFSFCYDIKSTDQSAKLVVSDNHTVSAPGSSVTYTNLQTDSVRGCITWTPGYSDTGTRVFTVTVKDSSCASGGIPITYTFTVDLYVWAVTKASNDTAICLGDTAQVSAVGGSAYIWTVLPGGSPITSLSCTLCKSPTVTPTVTTSYVVTSNSSSFCSQNIDTVVVTVKSLPNAFASSNTPVCPGDTLKLMANTLSGATYAWTGPNSFTSTQQNPFILNAQSVNSGTYGLVIKGSNGCSSTLATTSVYVGPPDAPKPNSNGPVCFGSTLSLTASTVSGTTVVYNWTGPNGFSSTQQNPSKANVTFADSGYYKVYAVIDGCVSFSDSVYVKVNGLPPAPTAQGPVTYCQDVTATALTATGTNLKWYTTPTGGVGTSTLTPSTANAGILKYYVSQTDGNGCEGPRDSVEVTILPKPAAPTVTTPITYCQGDTTMALTANGTNLKWYTSPTGGSGTTTAPVPSSATPGNSLYFVSQTSTINGCESDRSLIVVTIYPTPQVPAISSPAEYCESGPNTPALTTYVTGTGLTWYTSDTATVGSSTAPTVNTTTPVVDTYYISQTINGCEGPRGMLIVNVKGKPMPPTTANQLYCQFDTAMQLTAVGTNLLWYTSKTGGVGSTTAPTPPTGTPGVLKYYVSQTVNGCESDRDSIEVNIVTKPQPPVANDTTLCQYSIAGPLTANGLNLKWYDTAVGGVGSTTAPTPKTDTSGTYVWYVSQTGGSCESDRDTVVVTIVPRPPQPETDTAEFCLNGKSSQLTAVGNSLLWYTSPVGGVGSTTAPTPPTSPVGITYHYVTQTVNGCESLRDTMVVKVDTIVTARIMFANNPICLYDTAEVTHLGILSDSALFVWTWDGGTVIEGDSAGPYKVKWDTAGVKTITLFANHNDCKASDTEQIEILPIPEAYFDMIPEICVNQEIVTEVDSMLANASKFNWKFDSTDIHINSVDSNKFKVSWSTSGKKVVSLYTTSDSGCISDTYFDTVNVVDYPLAKIENVATQTICSRGVIELNARKLNGPHKYYWTPSDYFLENNDIKVTARIPSSGYLRLTVTDELGCEGTDSVFVGVKLCCDIVVPSAFSPNNDGKNDKFRIISNGNYKILSFRIVNRYGRVVFDGSSQYDSWDGTYKGIPQDVGTYYYFIKYSCEDDDYDNEIEAKGDVTLVR